ncbi:MAG: ATP/GTP-binding protein [Nitrososphaerota archaeon]
MAAWMNVVMIGPAGCGKTSLTASFGRWLELELGEKPAYVNLDPGVLNLPYEPDYDVRSIVRVDDLMRRDGLGPNGAMIRAVEIIEERLDEVVMGIHSLGGMGFRLIDTPGQMELFLFREMGPKIIERISEASRAVAVYILDPFLASSLSGLAVGVSMSIVTRLRLRIPVISAINKADLIDVSELEKLLADESELARRIASEEHGLIADLSARFMELVKEFSKAMRIAKISAKTGQGMRDLYNLISDALCECGDLT